MKAYDNSFLLHAKFLKKKSKNSNFDQKLFLPLQNLRQNFDKMLNISGNTEPIATNEVLNESLWY